MKHTITLEAYDIRSAIAEQVRRDHPKLAADKDVKVVFSGAPAGNGVSDTLVATVTFEFKPSYINEMD